MRGSTQQVEPCTECCLARRASGRAKQIQQADYKKGLRDAFKDMREGGLFWHFLKRAEEGRSYITNTLVHLGIDVCASIALLIRVQWI
jgi:hypothetical protein